MNTVATRQLRITLILVAIICLASALGACGSPEATHTSEADAGQPATDVPVAMSEVPETIPPIPTANPNDPLHLAIQPNLSGESIPADVIVEYTDYVIIGRVVEALPSKWTTPDAQRPANPFEFETVPDTFTIVTPYVIQLSVPLPLQPLTDPVIPLNDTIEHPISKDATQVVVVTNGGAVGQDTIVDQNPDQSLTVGDQVLLAISESRSTDPSKSESALVSTAAGPGWWTMVNYVITPDGMAVDYAGEQPAAELIAAILGALAQDPSLLTPTP